MKNSRLKARSFFDWRPILSPDGGKGPAQPDKGSGCEGPA